jgi:hypothetical protein
VKHKLFNELQDSVREGGNLLRTARLKKTILYRIGALGVYYVVTGNLLVSAVLLGAMTMYYYVFETIWERGGK